ncbi:MAG: NFACT family protein [Nanoarchaeota archaeon]|nr:NFACT family protein [Nanoarchaeota archaeon]
MKSQLSSLEVSTLTKEFQILIGAKIDQIYQPEKKQFLISIHVPRKGKHFLKIDLPSFIYLTPTKLKMPPPPEFCLTLRRRLNNTVIKKIKQINTERIIEIELEKESKYKLIIELFSKGNLILTNEKNQILALLEKQKWETRELKLKETYNPPPLSFNYFDTTQPELKKSITQSKKDKLITCLATEISLGGTYSEEICLLNNIDKNQPPSKVSDNQIKQIFKTIQDFLKKIEKPQGVSYKSKDITPFPLQIYQGLEIENFPSYNQALNQILNKTSFQIEKEKKESKYQEKIKSLKHIIKEQEDTIKKLQQQEQTNTKKANHIYEKYQELNTFLTKIKQAQKTMSWEEIKKQIKKHKQIKNINLKEKKIVLKI